MMTNVSSSKACLIVNLYSGTRYGYTFTAYLPETVEDEARTFEESHLIPYSETYLLDCINNEIVPLRLVTKLETEHGVNLIRYRNCVVCEVRDFRRPSKSKAEPLCRQVVLKPSTQTLLTDLEHLISKSYEDRKSYKRSRNGLKSHEDELIAFKRMRLCRPNYPFDRFEEDKTFVGFDADVEDKDELTLDQRHELEKKIVKETAVGLCLEPSKQVGLIANCAQYERFKWNSNELKRSIHSYVKKKQQLMNGSAAKQFPVWASDDEEEEVKTDGEPCQTLLDGEAEKRVDPRPFSSVLVHEHQKSFRKDFVPFFNYIKCIESKMLKRRVDGDKSDVLQLSPISVDYYPGPPPTNLEEIRALTQPAEPATLRPLSSDNSIQKTEEYLFETERRKHPHRTGKTCVVKVFQRNGMDMFFGELEQEAYTDDSNSPEGQAARGIPIKPYVLDPPSQQSSGSKCQFELGSQESVDLYVKQFMDIFTEDGRRPCKITYYKQGQPGPRTITTYGYNTQANTNKANSPTNLPPPPNSQSGGLPAPSHVGANVVIAHSGAPPPPHNSSNTIIVSVPSLPNSSHSTPSTISIPIVSAPPITTGSPIPVSSSASPSQTNPPVQIVHPQPRPQPHNIHITSASMASQLITTSTLTTTTPNATIQSGINQSSSPTNVNLNLHLNSTRLVQHRQLLTRPHIYNVNLSSQQPQLTMTRPGGTATIHQTPQLIQAQPQHHQQAGIRVKQPTLATLLLTGLPNSGSKPITVAIQPQPQQSQLQTIQLNSSSLETHHSHPQNQQVQIGGGAQSNNPIMIMVSPASGNALNAQNTISIPANSTHHTIPHHTGNVSLNLNAINLEGLLAASNNSITTLQQQPTYVTSTTLVNAGNNSITNSMGLTSTGVNNALNLFRLTNSTGSVTLQSQQHQGRQNALSVMNPQQQQATMVSMNSAGTGIILNSSMTNRGTPTRVVQHSPVRQVLQQQPPDLEEISVPDLNTLLSNGCGNNRVPAYSRAHSKGPSIDLNLNVNLNLAPPPPNARAGPGPSDMYGNGTSNGAVNVNAVDSIFNALSEAIGPDLEQKLETSIIQNSGHVSSTMSPSTGPLPKSSTMTLNDLLGSPPMSVSGAAMNHVSSPMQSPQSPSISSILSPISPNVVTSSIAFSTPRLSALLAGTPSADSSGNSLMLDSGNSRGSPNYGNLLDRLMSQGQTAPTAAQRSGGSRLNPIATAQPSVVLEHPVLAATLTQGTNPNLRQALTRPTAYRQIAPAPPPPNLQPQPTPQQHQQQQLLNLLGFVGTTGNQVGQGGQTIRINTTSTTTSVTGGNSGGR